MTSLVATTLHRGVRQQFHARGTVMAQLRGELRVWSCGPDSVDQSLAESVRIYPWSCCSKLVTTLAFAVLWEQGLVELDAPIRDYLRDLKDAPIGATTPRQHLTHTSGFISDPVEFVFGAPHGWTSAQVEASLRNAVPEAAPGSAAAYSIVSSWYVLSAICAKLTAMAIGGWEQSAVLDQLGLQDVSLGGPPSRPVSGGLIAVADVLVRNQGHLEEDSFFLSLFSIGMPSIGYWGSVGSLLTLMGTIAGLTSSRESVISKSTVKLLCAPHRVGMKDVRYGGNPVTFGLGVMADSRVFGRFCSDGTVGHLGVEGSFVFADPTNDLVVAACFDGLPGEDRAQLRRFSIANAVYRELDLQVEKD